MKRKNWVIATLFLGFCGNAVAQDNPLWLRHNAISPDGSTIAFCYKGDIFTVPVAGGRASQLTSNASYDTCPVWSPDGKKIAFASDREGSFGYILGIQGWRDTRTSDNRKRNGDAGSISGQ